MQNSANGSYKFSASPIELKLSVDVKSVLDLVGYADSDRIAREVVEYCEADPVRINEVCERLKLNEPWEYIRGWSIFHGLQFNLSPAVLIPRPETEQLVDLSYNEIVRFLSANKEGASANIVDIGTGSGCIIISLFMKLKQELPQEQLNELNFYAADISQEALEVAKANARLNEIAPEEINFEHSDLLANCNLNPTLPTFIVSNPPYVSESEYSSIDHSVKDYEPKLALVADNNGLEIYERILPEVNEMDVRLVSILLESSPTTIDGVNEIAQTFGLKGEIIEDIYGKDRFLVLR